jgi:hypothetical protein
MISRTSLAQNRGITSNIRRCFYEPWCLGLSFAVEAKSVVKMFGSIRALGDLSFSVKEGEIFGLIGPNGAGKTMSPEHKTNRAAVAKEPSTTCRFESVMFGFSQGFGSFVD